jgi:hypothetical protein
MTEAAPSFDATFDIVVQEMLQGQFSRSRAGTGVQYGLHGKAAPSQFNIQQARAKGGMALNPAPLRTAGLELNRAGRVLLEKL